MQNREKYLAAGLGAFVVLWLGLGMVSEWIFGPFRDRSIRLNELKDKTERLDDQMLLLALSRKQMTDWKAASLPPDRGANTAKRPDALDAQRLYQAWITNLAHLSGLDSPSVKPATSRRYGNAGRGATAKPVYVGVVVTIETETRYAQLCGFLDHFYQAKLLQRINKLEVESRESMGDPLLKVKLEAEGIALVDVPWRQTIFPETRLSQKLDDKVSRIAVETVKDFPTKLPFRIRIGSEYASVTAVSDNLWTVERGVDRTFAGHHAEGAVVELAPVQTGVKTRSREQFRELLASNVFIKPQPPKEYHLKVGPIAQQAFTRGQSLNYTIPVSDFDPTLGKPEFVVTSASPPGLEIDRGTGRVTWQPATDQAVGNFPLKLEVRHPSAKSGKEPVDLTIVFREPNAAPTAPDPVRQTAFLGRPWTYQLNFQDAETDPGQLSYRLENPPAGVTLQAASREVTWTPPATVAPGEYSVTVVATDSGEPPQSKSLAIPVTVREDDALFTYLVAAISIDGEWQAWFRNRARAQDSQTIVRVGDRLEVADIKGTVAEIGKDFVVLQQDQTRHRLELGQNLRELSAVTVAVGSPTVR